MGETIVELKNIRKEFPGVVALDDMNIQLKAGEIHGLIGENGAGKSTLIKILTGVYVPDKGEIIVGGEKQVFKGPAEARDKGISCVYQELNIVKELNIVDNMFIGNYKKLKNGFLDYRHMKRRTEEILQQMGHDICATEICGNLGMGQQQMVEIGKAILTNAKVLILDEPTSSLGEKEASELFRTVRILKEQGLAILFVSHKLEELFELCDIVTVMRDGRHISTTPIQDMTKDLLIRDMVGRTLDNLYPKVEGIPGEVALEIEGFSKEGQYSDISFKARRGEVLGFSGLVGAGRTELMQGVFAACLPDTGEMKVKGEKVKLKNPKDAIAHGIALLTEDRKTQGLVLMETIKKNLALVNIDKCKKGLFVDDRVISKQADYCVEKLSIRTPSTEKIVGELSGGNQQKVVIGKWMNADCDIYIFDEPTRGIDVGAKIEVYNVINELVKENKCVIVVSSELPEILGMCDRVIVMREGHITGETERGSRYWNQEAIMRAAWGGKLDE